MNALDICRVLSRLSALPDMRAGRPKPLCLSRPTIVSGNHKCLLNERVKTSELIHSMNIN